MVANNPALIERARRFLFRRKVDYLQTFNIQSPYVQRVLYDLAHFCRANKSTGHKDALVAARLDGRREVWLRLQQHLNLDNETLWRIYDGRTQPQPEGTE